MKHAKKLLALLLTTIMVLSCVVMAFAADKQNSRYDYDQNGKVVYTVLGDSIAAGYSLAGFVEGDKTSAEWPVVADSYPQLVGQALGAKKVHQDAHIGLRSADLRCLLCDDYMGDVASGWRLPTTDAYRTLDEETLAKERAAYQKHIAEADVITLGIGINDFSMPSGILNNVQNENFALIGAPFLDLVMLNPMAVMGDTLNSAYQLVNNAIYMEQVASLMIGFYRRYTANFDAIVAKIREINPNAKLLVIGYYNAAQDAFIKGALPVDIAALITPIIDLFNSHAANGAAAGGYTFVKMEHIDALFCDRTSPGYLNDFHPTVEGHRQMADRIMASLDEQPLY